MHSPPIEACFFLLLFASPLACGGAATKVDSAPPAPAAEPASSKAAEPPPSTTKPPSARVVGVEPSRESALYIRAKILFENPSTVPCRFVSYKLLWGSSQKKIPLDHFTVPAGETRERWLKINPEDGDLAALSTESGHVEVQTDCGNR